MAKLINTDINGYLKVNGKDASIDGHTHDDLYSKLNHIHSYNELSDKPVIYPVEAEYTEMGHYIKWSDGYAIYTGKFVQDITHYTTFNGFYGYTLSMDLPFEFKEEPIILYNTQVGNGFAMPSSANMNNYTDRVSFYATATTSGSQRVTVNFAVIGKWK